MAESRPVFSGGCDRETHPGGFGFYMVAARFPQLLSGRVPWERVSAGV